jgi:two-component system, OmpR family, heavy metal sensor histidine kinase CusS
MLSMKHNSAISSTAITTRLVLFYLVSTLVILFCTNWFQFRALTEDLEHEDNDFLEERLTNLRSVIANNPDTAAVLKDLIPNKAPGQHLHYLVRVLDAKGVIIAESSGLSAVPPSQFPQPLPAGAEVGHGSRHRGGDDRHYLLNSAWAAGFGNPHYRLVQMALDITDEDTLIAKYLLKMGISVLIGLGLAGLMGYVLTRKGLQPIQRMALKVAQITESDLHQRVRTGVWPKELEELTIALDSMLARLEESFARLSEFSANLAHELRTPINNLRGEAEVALSRARSPEEYRRIIESSIEEYERLARMVGDIMFLAQPEQDLVPEAIDARGALETLAEYYRTLAEEQLIEISIEGSGSISAEPHLFQRAVGNVISNALRYTPDGGQIRISIEPNDGWVDIAVSDSGIGIAAADLPRVFDRFYRSPQARQRHNQGVGLGLAIVRSIMSLHGGSVTITSELKRGTSVTLRFHTAGNFWAMPANLSSAEA